MSAQILTNMFLMFCLLGSESLWANSIQLNQKEIQLALSWYKDPNESHQRTILQLFQEFKNEMSEISTEQGHCKKSISIDVGGMKHPDIQTKKFLDHLLILKSSFCLEDVKRSPEEIIEIINSNSFQKLAFLSLKNSVTESKNRTCQIGKNNFGEYNHCSHFYLKSTPYQSELLTVMDFADITLANPHYVKWIYYSVKKVGNNQVKISSMIFSRSNDINYPKFIVKNVLTSGQEKFIDILASETKK